MVHLGPLLIVGVVFWSPADTQESKRENKSPSVTWTTTEDLLRSGIQVPDLVFSPWFHVEHYHTQLLTQKDI